VPFTPRTRPGRHGAELRDAASAKSSASNDVPQRPMPRRKVADANRPALWQPTGTLERRRPRLARRSQCGATRPRDTRIWPLTCVVPTGFEPVSPPSERGPGRFRDQPRTPRTGPDLLVSVPGRFGSLPLVFRPDAGSMRDQAVDAVIQGDTPKTMPNGVISSAPRGLAVRN
jgi:hypothetical protein